MLSEEIAKAMEESCRDLAHRVTTEMKKELENQKTEAYDSYLGLKTDDTEKPYPIMVFHTDDELQCCLKEWQERLFLSDWNICASLVPGEDIPDMAGDSTVQWANSCGTIRIREGKDMPVDLIEKEPHEKILVHELLHFKYMGFEGMKTIEGIYWDEKQHQILEQMAKSLIMAKYHLSYDWFKQ